MAVIFPFPRVALMAVLFVRLFMPFQFLSYIYPAPKASIITLSRLLFPTSSPSGIMILLPYYYFLSESSYIIYI